MMLVKIEVPPRVIMAEEDLIELDEVEVEVEVGSGFSEEVKGEMIKFTFLN